MKRRHVVAALYGLFLVTLGVVAVGGILCSCREAKRKQGMRLVRTFRLRKGREMSLWEPLSWEVGRGVCYEVKADGQVRRPMTLFGVVDAGSQLRFRALEARGGDLVALVESGSPYQVVLIHDFTTGSSWPGDPREAGEALLALLRADVGDGRYSLRHLGFDPAPRLRGGAPEQ